MKEHDKQESRGGEGNWYKEKKRLHNAGKENRMVIRSDEHIGVKKEEEKIEKEEKRRKKESREERV